MHVENIKMAKFEPSTITEWDFMTVWSFKIIRLLFCMEKVAGEQRLASFPVQMLLIFRKFKLGHLRIFEAFSLFLAFFLKVIA